MSTKLIIGSGISGTCAANLLTAKGITPVIFDGNDKLKIEDIREKLNDPDEVYIYLGFLPQEVIDVIDEVILSPGVPIDSPMVNDLRALGIPISGEVELAYGYDKGTLIAITGTNGKTTTTSLVGKIMQDYMHKAFVVGNIGNAYTKEVLYSENDSVTVAEISSFQLETVHSFHPVVSAILNITPDHLNRHHTMRQYIIEKEKIALNQNNNDYVILNYEDDELRDFANLLKNREEAPNVVFFSSLQKLNHGFYYENDAMYMNMDGEDKLLLNVNEMNIIGMHNVENALAAMAMAYVYGVPVESIVASVRTFTAVPHRIEFVAEKHAVKYYNDSKGTNVDAAIKGIMAMSTPTCLIGGGYDKGVEFDEWIEAFGGKVKKLVLIGQTAEKIANCAKDHGFTDYVFASDLKEAVTICAGEALPGESVLLSPACASWGMFKNYEERGDMFKQFVEEL